MQKTKHTLFLKTISFNVPLLFFLFEFGGWVCGVGRSGKIVDFKFVSRGDFTERDGSPSGGGGGHLSFVLQNKHILRHIYNKGVEEVRG